MARSRHPLLLSLVLAACVTPAQVTAQVISACFDCALKRLTPVSFLTAQCCKPGWVSGPDCDALSGQGWDIQQRDYSNCWVDTPVSDNEDCRGNGCEIDYCQDPGCYPGYCQIGSPGCACSEAEIDPCGCCQNYSPIVVDVMGDGVKMSDAREGVPFDINGLGHTYWVGWPRGGDDAWLALDRNSNGVVDSGVELFGNTTRLTSGRVAAHGYEALAELDSNRDGFVDASDMGFHRLLLWTDSNRNGVSEPHELGRLEERGISGLSTEMRPANRRDQWGNRFAYHARALRSSAPIETQSWDVFPVVAPVSGIAPSRACSGRSIRSQDDGAAASRKQP